MMMNLLSRFPLVGVAVLISTVCLAADAEKPAQPDQKAADAKKPAEPDQAYVRLRRDADEKPLALETAIVRFRNPTDRVQIDLIGAIHIGDKSYYEELNRRFQAYDAVLYELVAPSDAAVPNPGQSPGSAIGGLQVGMKSMLELAFQLDHIDYRAKNLVHADMTPEEFSQKMKERNESFTGMFFRVMGRAFGESAKDPLASGDMRLLAAMMAKDRAYQMKLIMAEEFSDLKGQMNMFDGPDGSTIVTERNKKALEVLKEQLAKGKKRLAIFYGAGHLADLQARLEQDFGMKLKKTEWVSAWSLKPLED